MQLVARGSLIWESTHTASFVGLISAAGALPILLLSPLGGAISDKLDRKLITHSGQSISALFFLLIAIAAFTNTITWQHLLVVSILMGSIHAFMVPARQALIPQLVGPENTNNAMALNGAGSSIVMLIAPAISGFLYTFIGAHGIFSLMAALAFISALFIRSISPHPVTKSENPLPIFAEIRDGISYAKSDGLIVILLFTGIITSVLTIPFKFLLPVYADIVYGKDAWAVGILISTIGLGTLLSSIGMAIIGNRNRGKILILSSLASGIGLLAVTLVTSLYVAIPLMLLIGFGEAGRRVLNVSLLMEHVENHYRGRVMSVFMMSFGLMPIVLLPAGYAFDLLGPRVTIGSLSVLIIVITILLFITQDKLRNAQ